MEPMLIDKIISKIEKNGGHASEHDIKILRDEADRLWCDRFSLLATGKLPKPEEMTA